MTTNVAIATIQSKLENKRHARIDARGEHIGQRHAAHLRYDLPGHLHAGHENHDPQPENQTDEQFAGGEQSHIRARFVGGGGCACHWVGVRTNASATVRNARTCIGICWPVKIGSEVTNPLTRASTSVNKTTGPTDNVSSQGAQVGHRGQCRNTRTPCL